MNRVAAHSFMVLMVAFILGPLVVIVWMSFTPSELFDLPFRNFTLKWYSEVFKYPGFVDGFLLSVRLALSVAVISTILGFLAGYALVRFRFHGQLLFEAIFMSPLFVPSVAFGIAVLQFVSELGLYNTFISLMAAHVAHTVPFSVRAAAAAIRAVPRDTEWAARNLGANWLMTLLTVTVPLSLRGTMAGFIFAFMISFDEVTITIFVAGPSYQTIPVQMYNYLTDQLDPTVAALSSILIFLSILVIVVLERLMGLHRLMKK